MDVQAVYCLLPMPPHRRTRAHTLTLVTTPHDGGVHKLVPNHHTADYLLFTNYTSGNLGIKFLELCLAHESSWLDMDSKPELSQLSVAAPSPARPNGTERPALLLVLTAKPCK